jgi:hypothetical protein
VRLALGRARRPPSAGPRAAPGRDRVRSGQLSDSVLLIGKSQLVSTTRSQACATSATKLRRPTTPPTSLAGSTCERSAWSCSADRSPRIARPSCGTKIGTINPRVIFVQGLAGIPGLIINQVQGAFAAEHQDAARAPTYTRLAAGEHAIPVPDLVPPRAAFATAQVDTAIYAFSIATKQ